MLGEGVLQLCCYTLWHISLSNITKHIIPEGWGIHRGTLVHRLSSFPSSGHRLNWMRTESHSVVRFSVDLIGKFDLVLSNLVCNKNMWKELNSRTEVPLHIERVPYDTAFKFLLKQLE